MNDKKYVETVSTEDLIPFKNHPFKMRDGEENEQLAESIRTQGAIEPLIVRCAPAGKYEVISGHRSLRICKELGITNVPVIVKNLTDDEAVIMMVDTNLHRESLLPSEKAFAYKMKLDAIKHQGRTSRQLVGKSESADMISKESGRQIQRYIRLTQLIPELLKKVDEKQIALTPAVELSYLTEAEQLDVLNEIEYVDSTPNLSQAQRLHYFSKQGRLNKDMIYAILSEEKANQREKLKIPADRIRKYFPKEYTEKQIEETIVKLCEAYYQKRLRDRDAR